MGFSTINNILTLSRLFLPKTQVKARTRQAKGEAETKSGDYDNDANMEQKKKKAHGVPRLIRSAMEVAQAACRSYTRYNVF
ncbi:hypothetical protein BFJ66_g9648 [Fusarium oxysporum f. sp. cepae]|uniref:Uncharacterized protein n=1 Tax=Fusarium oxysporum f. sp. cepae TaxID=396571 RepID=A0A3L6P0Y8_FUSOX|nr:hypothetical protein BFJ65_g3373 [Fusarium oxysporum f. sp. cepae]RKK44272.1 hypothetical protein BFJ66_g9648 [Fusarium oxysporum f. sp. cepae]RKK55257.1 hypothetical protein BFJ67_g4356 [Fusarium oxysporum f. sp. cepae]